MDAEANNKYLKFTSTPELSRLESDLVNDVEKQETESDGEEDLSGSLKSSSNAARKRSSPVYVYTYKVSNYCIYYFAYIHTLKYIYISVYLSLLHILRPDNSVHNMETTRIFIVWIISENVKI